MCKFRPGSGNFLGFSGKTKENTRKTTKNLRNRGSKFLISYFQENFLIYFLAVPECTGWHGRTDWV